MTEKIQENALIAGSFDPITKGHMYLIDYACKKYRKVFVTVFINAEKQCTFPVEKRLEMVKAACVSYPNAEVFYDSGMQYQFAQRHDISVAIRGYRNQKDYEYEQIIAKFNAEHLEGFRTELIRCPEELAEISSTEAKKRIEKKQDISHIIPKEVLPFLK